jgi:ribosomal protein L34E
VHAVMLGGESPLSRCAWSRRAREAPGRHREVGSEGSVERTCGARDTNRIRGVVRSGRAGTRQQCPPSTVGACFINPASMHGRYDSLPREICGVSRCGTEGGAIRSDRPAEVSRRHSMHAKACRRPERWIGGVACGGAARWHPARCWASRPASGMNSRLALRDPMLRLG